MKIRDFIAVALALALTLSSMVAHGWIRHRWGASEQTERLGKSMHEMPTEFGDWELRESKEVDPVAVKLLECEGSCFDKVYVNRDPQSDRGRPRCFFGPSGPIATHSPAVCYRNSDYRIIETIPLTVGDDEFQLMVMERNSVDRTRMHVVYGWRFEDRWETPESPRRHFMFKPHLYKLQIVLWHPNDADFQRVGAEESDKAQEDVSLARSFLSSFLPAFEATIRPD